MQSKHTIFLSQVKYAKALFKKFRMTECNPTSTPMEVGIKLSTYTDSPLVNESLYWKLVGSLIYLTTTQSDLCFLVICLFLNSCLILKSYIGKLQNESINIQRDPWLWHSISEICWLHASRAYWFQLGWISWYKEVRNRLCVHSWFW